jgi:signal transduction histidine kinase
MKKRPGYFHPIFVFILAQLAWLSLLGLWIYWYVSNYIIFKQVGDNLAPQIVSKGTNVITLVWGLILLVLVLGGMYFIFIYLTKQIHLTRLYDNFIANVTHELKSPLASIQLYLETLDLRKVSRQKQQEFIGLMKKDVDRLNNLINSILNLSGQEKKKIAQRYHVYPAEKIGRDLIMEVAEKFKLRPDQLNIEGKADCTCVADREALKIVYDNLVDNALKFSANSFHLIIELACSSKMFILKLTDEGIGIPKKDQDKIFTRFYRVQNRNAPSIGGTGLGLHMVREIIRSHGGKISVFSEGENRGSTFTIELPIYQKAKRRYLKRLLRSTSKLEKKDHDR